MGLTGIAELTGKGNPAVVANWRTRLSGFPPARIADKHPKFDLVEVLEWYRDQGPRSTDFTPVTMEKAWPLLVAGFQANASVHSARSSMVALVLLQSLLHNDAEHGAERWGRLVNEALAFEPAEQLSAVGQAPDLAHTLVAVAADLEQSDERTAGLLVDQLTFQGADVGYAADLIDALDQLADVPRRAVLWPIMRLDPDRSRSLRATGRRLSALMLAVAQVPAGGSVLDPACGEGALLLECADRVGPSVALFGQELDPTSWCIARSQMLILGVDGHLGHKVADSLREPLHSGQLVDAVIVDPPLGPDTPALDRWIEFGFGYVKPGGRVVVALPMNELVPVKSARRSPDRRMVSALSSLAQSGLVEGVLITPPRLRGDVVGPIGVFSFARGRAQGEVGDRRHRSVTVVQLLEDPSKLIESGVVDGVAEQFEQGGFDEARFVLPLEAQRVDAAVLVPWLEKALGGVGSREWAQRSTSESIVLDHLEPALIRATPPARPSFRPIPTATSSPVTEEVWMATARLIEALEHERHDIPDDVWRRLEPRLRMLHKMLRSDF